eukprot:COSAG01_NODE_2108_length_8408_cov_138.235768_9_plen_153_part_00
MQFGSPWLTTCRRCIGAACCPLPAQVLVGAKYGAGFHHQTDLIIRRSYDFGKMWQPWQMLFSPSAFYHNSTFGATVGTVLDRHTGKIWAMLTVSNRQLTAQLSLGAVDSRHHLSQGNNTFLAVMSSSDHVRTQKTRKPRERCMVSSSLKSSI